MSALVSVVPSPEWMSAPPPAPPELLSALVSETDALTSLLEVSRRELDAMGAWRMGALHELLTEKAAIITRLEAATTRRHAALLTAGFSSLGEAAGRFPELTSKRQQILASVEALRALSRQALEQASRRLKWVATRRRALSGATVSGGGGTYGPRGDAPRLADGIGLNGRA
ncbi:MAG: flagellar export chaperone FlgN [Myxococcales bacterium]|nr:flagellar export chaperone FlgN [Myxococcales bacterium]